MIEGLMSKHPKKREVEVEIESLSSKGNGIGTYVRGDGLSAVAEVPFAVPGDTARALLIRKRRGISSGILQEVVKASPDRVEPRCVHFGSCGGCRWQQLAYSNQLEIKQAMVRHAFARLLTHRVDVKPIVACDPPWHYRNKMEFSFSSNAAGTKFFGLVLDSSRGKVFNLTECHLVNSWFVDGVTAVRKWWMESDLSAYHPPKDVGSLRTLALREGMRTGDRLVLLTVSGNPEYALKKHHLESFVAFMRDAIEPDVPPANLSIFLRIQQAAKGMETNFYEMHLYGPDHLREELQISYDASEPMSLQFKVSPSAFFQPNTYQAEKLYSLALTLAQIPKNSVVYDLYCGTGTLGILASKLASQVVGIEISPESSLDARANAASNGCQNVTILTGSVPDVLENMRAAQSAPPPDVVLVDPPRAGLDSKALKCLIELAPSKIVYVSCNPKTQSENVVELCEAGYQLALIQPVDQFPQTPHVENIAILLK